MLPVAREARAAGRGHGSSRSQAAGQSTTAGVAWREALSPRARRCPATPGRWPRLPARDDLACLIYTSGTGGTPNGVMLSHGNILPTRWGASICSRSSASTTRCSCRSCRCRTPTSTPAGQFLPISLGAQIYYADGVDTLAANLLEARPTIMTAVPRLLRDDAPAHPAARRPPAGCSARLFEQAVALGRKRYETPGALAWSSGCSIRPARAAGARQGAGALRRPAEGAGLGRRAAQLRRSALFFTALGVPVLQGYGQTEAAPVVSCNPPSRIKLHTVGPPLHGRRGARSPTTARSWCAAQW